MQKKLKNTKITPRFPPKIYMADNDCPPISKIVRLNLKFNFFLKIIRKIPKLSAYSPDNGQFLKFSADNRLPRTIKF